MVAHDQLEIIRPNGQIEFCTLDPARGITNVGQHPANDIVVDGVSGVPFQAVIDHRQKPYYLMVLSQGGETRVSGQLLPPRVACEIHHWDTIEFDGHALILLESEAGEVEAPPPVEPGWPQLAAAPVVELAEPEPELEGEAGAVPAVAVAMLTPRRGPGRPAPGPFSPRRPVSLPSRPFDEPDEIIVADISEREWTIDCDQAVHLQVSIANGGDIVAAFVVRVEGLDDEWVTIAPPQLNLNEGERATVTIAISPPRLPTTLAGAYHFAVIVSSPNYPRQRSQRGATLVVNPYYEYAVGDLSPKQQTVSYFKHTGRATLPIANRGNSDTPFRLEGTDDERACSFEFQVPGEAANLAMQAEMRLVPEETVLVPVLITPLSRRLFGLRRRTYSFTVSTSLLEGAQMPRMVLGQLRSSPLIGFWHMALVALVLAGVLAFMFMPGSEPRLYSEQGGRVSATSNQISLRYNASRFMSLGPESLLNRINGATLKLALERKKAGAPDDTYEVVNASLAGPDGATADAPTTNVVYRLTVENWLSFLFPRLARSATYDVSVIPVLPVVKLSPEQAVQVQLGQKVTLAWNVQYAERLVLRTQEGLVIETIPTPPASGSYEAQPEKDTTYVLEAYNLYTGDKPETDSTSVKVFIPPTATPPPPVVEFFAGSPDRIIEGTPVVFSWRVTGADTVQIESDDPADRPVQVGPAGPPISRQPAKTTLYTLRAIKGSATAVAYQQVSVEPAPPTPSPTPVPLVPAIEFFTIDPTEVVKGTDDEFTLAWSVTGKTTNIELTGPDPFTTISGLNPVGDLTLPVGTTTMFVLTAYNGEELKTSATVQLKMLDATPTPEPPPVPPTPPPPTATPPASGIIFFKASAADAADDDKVVFVSNNPTSYQVVAGTKINLSWQVKDAAKVTLSLNGASLGDQPFEGSVLQTIKGDAQYVLKAANAAEKTVTAQLNIYVSQQVPPSPRNFSGSRSGPTNIKLTWDYNTVDENRIVGFRIYRAELPPGSNFQRVASEGDLAPGKRDWTDSSSEICQKTFVYFAVAVYVDVVSGNQTETPASPTSWSSSLPCPAAEPSPTPVPTATSVPPHIAFFKVAAANPADAAKVEFAGGNPPTYKVVSGTSVVLSWQVDGAVSATLTRPNGSPEAQPPQVGVLSLTVDTTIANTYGPYTLTALNAQGSSSTTSLQIETP